MAKKGIFSSVLLLPLLVVIQVQADNGGLRAASSRRELWDMQKYKASQQQQQQYYHKSSKKTKGKGKQYTYTDDDYLYNVIDTDPHHVAQTLHPDDTASDSPSSEGPPYSPDDDLYNLILPPQPTHATPPPKKQSDYPVYHHASSKKKGKSKGSKGSPKHSKKEKKSYTSDKKRCYDKYGKPCRDGDRSSRHQKLQAPTPSPVPTQSPAPTTFFPPILTTPSIPQYTPSPVTKVFTPFPTLAKMVTTAPTTPSIPQYTPSPVTKVFTPFPTLAKMATAPTPAPSTLIVITAAPIPVYNGTPPSSAPINGTAPVALPPIPAPVNIVSTLPPDVPTESPTAVPVLQIIDNLPVPIKKKVTTIPFYVSLTGNFDPQADEERIFDVVYNNFRPYSMANVGNMLDDYEMFVRFLEDRTTVGRRQLQQTVTTMVEVIVVFTLEGTDQEQLNVLDEERLSRTVQRYFMAGHKQSLLDQFDAAGIEISDMHLFATLPPKDSQPGQQPLEQSNHPVDIVKTDAPQPHGPHPVAFPENKPMKQGRSTSAVIAAVISGVIIFVALGAVLISHRRRQRNRFTPTYPTYFPRFQKPPSITGDGSSFDDGSADAVSHTENHIKPAALHVRNQRERDSARKASSNSTISSIPSAGCPHFTIHPAPGDQSSGPTKSSASSSRDKSLTEEKAEITETALALLEDSPNRVAAGALKCLDGDVSVGELHHNYPEFELYQGSSPPSSPPSSPLWHADNFSVATPYSAEEEYLKARKRWHDEVNDLESIPLPDHNSEMGYTYHSQSADSAAGKSKNSSRSY